MLVVEGGFYIHINFPYPVKWINVDIAFRFYSSLEAWARTLCLFLNWQISATCQLFYREKRKRCCWELQLLLQLRMDSSIDLQTISSLSSQEWIVLFDCCSSGGDVCCRRCHSPKDGQWHTFVSWCKAQGLLDDVWTTNALEASDADCKEITNSLVPQLELFNLLKYLHFVPLHY